MTEPALDLVIAALAKIRETNDHFPRASRTVLAQLQTAIWWPLPCAKSGGNTRRTKQNYLSRFANACAFAGNARILPARAHKPFSA